MVSYQNQPRGSKTKEPQLGGSQTALYLVLRLAVQSSGQALALVKKKKKNQGLYYNVLRCFTIFFLFHSHSFLILFVSNTSHFSRLLTVQYFILEAIDSFSKQLHL